MWPNSKKKASVNKNKLLVWPWNRQAALHVKLESANVSSSTMTEMSNYSFKAIEGRIKILDNLDLHKPWLVNHYEDTLVSWTNPSQSHRDKSQNNWIFFDFTQVESWWSLSQFKKISLKNNWIFFDFTQVESWWSLSQFKMTLNSFH